MPIPRLIRTGGLLLAGLLTFAQDTTLVILRHGEKHTRGAQAELNARGLQRAEALVPELAAFRPVALFASDYKRTQQTLAPLGRHLKLPVQARPRGSEEALAAELLETHAGKAVVVCTHSDLVGAWVMALGLPWSAGEIEGFDRLWIVRVKPDGTRTLEERPQKALREGGTPEREPAGARAESRTPPYQGIQVDAASAVISTG